MNVLSSLSPNTLLDKFGPVTSGLAAMSVYELLNNKKLEAGLWVAGAYMYYNKFSILDGWLVGFGHWAKDNPVTKLSGEIESATQIEREFATDDTARFLAGKVGWDADKREEVKKLLDVVETPIALAKAVKGTFSQYGVGHYNTASNADPFMVGLVRNARSKK